MTLTAHSHADRLVLEAVGVALSTLPANARIAVAFSGGVDSSVLLDAAVRVAGASRCIALHVHHGLSAHADAWLAHCETFAREHDVELAARRVDVPHDAGMGVEAAAREARYRALEEMCATYRVDSLWIAQHADDQAETVLLQLLRGAGLAGLAAMAPERLAPGASVTRVRPLLHLLRAQLEHYASGRSLRWVDDESNADTRYARNALRHEVTPALTVHFPGFRDALSRTAAHAASAQRLLDTLARIDMEDAARDEGRALSHEVLLALDDDRGLNLLRYWMRTLGFVAASSARLSDALRQLREVGEEHQLRIDHAGQTLRSYRGLVYWEAGDSNDPADETTLRARAVSELRWQGESVWHVPQWRGTFVFAPVDDPASATDAVPREVLQRAMLSARSRSGGERIRLIDAASAPNRTLKNLFQERGVPAWKRDVPLLYVGDALLFVPGLGVNRAVLNDDPGDTGVPVKGAHEKNETASTFAAGALVRIVWREDILLA